MYNLQVQSILKAKPEDMLSSLDYLMHVTYSLILNPHINIVLYVSTCVELVLGTWYLVLGTWYLVLVGMVF